MLQLNTTVTFSLRVPLGLGCTVLDTIRLPNVGLEMVALNKKKTQKNKNKQQHKDGRNRKKKRDCLEDEGGHSPAPLMRISKQVYINHQKLFSFKSSRGNYSQFP